MRILQITSQVPFPPKNGGSVAVNAFAEGLYHLGATLDIFSINTSRHYVSRAIIEQYNSPVTDNVYTVYVNTDISLFYLIKNLIFSGYPYNVERFYNSAVGKELTDLIKHNPYDIIQLEGINVLPYIPLIRDSTTAKVAYRAHNVENKIWKASAFFKKNILKKWYLRILANRLFRLEIRAINTYDFLIPITQDDYNFFQKYGNSKPAIVLPTGIDVSKFRGISNSGDTPDLFYIGALDWLPNQEALKWFVENCWHPIKKEFPWITCHVAGRNAPGWLPAYLKHNNITYHGEVEDVYEYMTTHTIMIVPLFAGSGLRIKILEGMAAGKAIVTTSTGIGGIPAKNMRHIVIADTVADFIESVQKLILYPLNRNKISENAREFVSKNYAYLQIANTLLQFYKNHL